MKKWLKKLIALSMVGAMAFSLAACSPDNNNEEPTTEEQTEGESTTLASELSIDAYEIAIIQLVEHPALDASREGFLRALKDNGFEEGVNLTVDFQNAQNDQSNLKTISQGFVQKNPDLVLAISTPAAQSISAETEEIPILFTAVTDPVDVKLVESIEVPGTNLSGTSDDTPVKDQIDLLQALVPEAKTVGILYDSGERNSEIQANAAKEALTAAGLSYEVGTVANTNEIQQVTESIITKVDALYIPTDNTFASAMPIVGDIAMTAKIPVICGEEGMCAEGGLATIGIDYDALGYQTGLMAVEILNGQNTPDQMPVQFQTEFKLKINQEFADAIEIDIPDEIMDTAEFITE